MNHSETLTREEPVTAELLAELYRNVTMGSENPAAVVPHIRDRFLLKDVTYQLEKYADFTNRTASLLHKRAVKPKEPALMKVAMSRGGIVVNTLLDDSDGHVAEMIVKGTRTGLDQLEEKFAQLAARGADEDAVLALPGSDRLREEGHPRYGGRYGPSALIRGGGKRERKETELFRRQKRKKP